MGTEGNGIRGIGLLGRVTRKVLGFGVGNNTRINVANHIAIVCNCEKGSGKNREGLCMFFTCNGSLFPKIAVGAETIFHVNIT